MSAQVRQLQPIMQGHFPWHKVRLTFTAAFLLSLIKWPPVTLTHLAHGLNGKVKPKSNDRRIQRCFAHVNLPDEGVARLILHLLPVSSDFTISMDRTNGQWGRVTINNLAAGKIHQGVVFPIGWMLLPKRGNSQTQERIDWMVQGLQTIPKSQIRLVVADREFSGQEGFVWLDEQDIRFVIRIKENARIKSAKGPSPLTKQVANLQIHPLPGMIHVGPCSTKHGCG